MTEPKYRFKKTDGHTYPAINTRTVGEVFSFVTEKNKGRMVDNVITNSAEFGLIPQREFFDKDIASKDNTDGYTVIQKGDFVYNPRKSSTAPYGPFNCYRLEEKGIVSPLYTCLRQKMDGVSADYLEWYFASNAWHRYIYNNGAQGGARHDRVGMTNDLMKGIPVGIPSVEEQNKISELLDSVTSLISTLTEEVRLWEEKKKGVMQKIFSQEVRFKDENGEDYPEWEEKTVRDVAYMYNGDRGKNYPSATDYVAEGVPFINAGDLNGFSINQSCAKISIEKYNTLSGAKLKVGDILYCLRGSLGKKGIVDFSTGGTVASSLVAIRAHSIDRMYLYYFLDSPLEFSQRKICDEGAAQPNLSAKNVGNYAIPVPCNKEQIKIVNVLTSIDEVIFIKKQKLETWQNIKKGLLQQMFV